MGFIIWYKVQIEEADAGAGSLPSTSASLLGGGLPLKVSNDVVSGQYIIDADITLTMKEGASASAFEIRLPNLPAEVVKTLKSKQKEAVGSGKPLLARIFLGYFDDVPLSTVKDPTMVGAITFLKSKVNENGILETEIRGQELGGYRLRTSFCSSKGQRGPTTADNLVKEIVENANKGITDDNYKVEVADNISLNQTWPNFTLQGNNGLQALEQITRKANSPLIIRDKKIFMGKAVGGEQGPTFDPDNNIVQLDEAEYSEEIPEVCGRRKNSQRKTEPRSQIELKVLGDPKLRVGQNVTLKLPDVPAGNLRVAKVIHDFSMQTGYVCEVSLVVAEPGQRVQSGGGAKGAVDRIKELAESLHDQRPAINIGEVKEYEPGNQGKHLVTLNYGQSPPPEAVAPSIETPVDDDTQLHRRAITSPFAFHKCGLTVPIYPKMRAWLAHNRGLVNDAMLAGFLWAENPAYERPQNEPGDYWLCLPTELGQDGLPTGKGVNDLTDKTGLRVIQAKGLHIVVGEKKLPAVGERPTLPEKNTIVIEHQSGTQITIDSDGVLKIETSNKDITLTNGSVSMKLSGAAVEVS